MKPQYCTGTSIRMLHSDKYCLAAGIGCQLGHSLQILCSAYSFVEEFFLHLQC
jgi:hypothetical protein